MEDKKTTAIVIGVIAGVALVGTALAIYLCRPEEQTARDINYIVEQAKKTVARLEEAVDLVRKSTTPAKASAKA